MPSTYKISVVIPIFNTAEYLGQTFACLENQTIGFSNIQTILINDGSTDNSSRLCRDFQERHMDNVLYVEFDTNYGVSHARNTGLSMAEGKYITFWDSDDLWSLNAMERAVDFLEIHQEEIDLVSANIEFFDSRTNQHPLNFPLEQSVVIDIHQDYQKIRSTGVVSVIKTSAAKEYPFDENQSCWEDTKYLNQLMLKKQKYGMLSDVIYYYRKRRTNDSASQSYSQNKQFYLHDLSALFEGIYDESMRRCQNFIPMMQYLMAYALGYRFCDKASILNNEELEQYHGVLKNCLLRIEDRYIKEIPNVNERIKCEMLAFKYGIDMENGIGQWRKMEEELGCLYTRLGRMTSNYDVLKKWFSLKQKNKGIGSYFEKNGYHRAAVYGMSDLGKFLWKELKNSNIQVVYGIDRRAEKMETELPVLTIKDNLPEVDVIIVTAVFFFDEIDEALRKKTACPVISIEDILYSTDSE